MSGQSAWKGIAVLGRRPTRAIVAMALGVALLGGPMLATGPARAQQVDPTNPAAVDGPLGQSAPAESSLDALYRRSRAARTTGELTDLLEQCRRRQQESADPAQRGYLRQLAAWLLNRRGEALADQAQRVAQRGDLANSQQLSGLADDDFTLSAQLSDNWRAWHNRGLVRATLGQYEAALDDFTRALQLEPTRSDTRFNRAELRLQLGRYQEALADYSQIVQSDPADLAARRGRAHARFYLEQFDQALADFNQIVQDNPQDAAAYADRADLYAYLGNWAEAAADYRTAVRLDPSLGRAYQSAAWLMATCPDGTYRDAALGVRAARRAIELDGADDYRYLDTLAAALASAGDYAAAVDAIDRAIALAPGDLVAQLEQRRASYQAGNPYRDTAD